uniref:Uncharacterized protein n=1 Tax=Acrobeloides nanus TaxID=290746 RepID=A0A914DRM2_9BILA
MRILKVYKHLTSEKEMKQVECEPDDRLPTSSLADSKVEPLIKTNQQRKKLTIKITRLAKYMKDRWQQHLLPMTLKAFRSTTNHGLLSRRSDEVVHKEREAKHVEPARESGESLVDKLNSLFRRGAAHQDTPQNDNTLFQKVLYSYRLFKRKPVVPNGCSDLSFRQTTDCSLGTTGRKVIITG